jgi:hypothetical protein
MISVDVNMSCILMILNHALFPWVNMKYIVYCIPFLSILDVQYIANAGMEIPVRNNSLYGDEDGGEKCSPPVFMGMDLPPWVRGWVSNRRGIPC